MLFKRTKKQSAKQANRAPKPQLFTRDGRQAYATYKAYEADLKAWQLANKR